ncbi:hypothetical protein NDU88_002570 [Pleurodeles waltl]|uniref:Uncharacterized protein n=1 Tax=Pleurodeles waltl TaxID=8319 RepID=A0AAV7LG50_PLEWA|nr:hypothetical protein NDU88_002570 [Pleurodeles waltl]
MRTSSSAYKSAVIGYINGSGRASGPGACRRLETQSVSAGASLPPLLWPDRRPREELQPGESWGARAPSEEDSRGCRSWLETGLKPRRALDCGAWLTSRCLCPLGLLAAGRLWLLADWGWTGDTLHGLVVTWWAPGVPAALVPGDCCRLDRADVGRGCMSTGAVESFTALTT